jgi:hypothetical protein
VSDKKEATKQKEEKRKNPEEQEGMPQRQHRPDILILFLILYNY